MATDMPPHNLNEIVSACVRLLDDPDATVRELCEHVRGPDYPTDRRNHHAGRRVCCRCTKPATAASAPAPMYAREAGQHRDHRAALPGQPEQGHRADRAADARQETAVARGDIRDESDHANPIAHRADSALSNRVDAEQLMGHLFATTDLEKSYRANFNVDRPGRQAAGQGPQDPSCREWLAFRTDTVRRRLKHRLDKVERRLHLLDGLLVAFLNLDEVIRIIRTEDEPKPALMARFALSEDQADYILDTKLKQLARLEEMKIRGEQDGACEGARQTHRYPRLARPSCKKLIKDELLADAKKFGDVRRVAAGGARCRAGDCRKPNSLPASPITIVLSEQGLGAFGQGPRCRCGRRCRYREGDALLQCAVRGRSNAAGCLPRFHRPQRTPRLAHTLPSRTRQRRTVERPLLATVGRRFRQTVAVPAEDDDALSCSPRIARLRLRHQATRISAGATRPARRCSRSARARPC